VPASGWYAPRMLVKCPVCDADNSAAAVECRDCGKLFSSRVADLPEDLPPIDGLEQTIHDPQESASGPVAPFPELERTQLARRDLKVATELVPDVEQTQIEFDPDAVSRWSSASVEMDLGRETDDGERTPAPQDTGVCPWCNEPAAGVVCDNCGRRRSRYSVAVAAAEREEVEGETVLCPACFGRVPGGARCTECGVPFAVVEL
jgi:hypothetical protein